MLRAIDHGSGRHDILWIYFQPFESGFRAWLAYCITWRQGMRCLFESADGCDAPSAVFWCRMGASASGAARDTEEEAISVADLLRVTTRTMLVTPGVKKRICLSSSSASSSRFHATSVVRLM